MQEKQEEGRRCFRKMRSKLEETLHMVGGEGETSYANNSRLQEKAIIRTKPALKNAIGEMYRELLPERLVVADLGCSSGPNTFLVVSQVLRTVGELSRLLEQEQPPEVQFFLNDLPGNDFNTVFLSLEKFKRKIEEEIILKGEDGALVVPQHYIVGVPGSFYGRLFPSRSVHFFHSSYCLHWLSQVPEGMEELNKGNIYYTASSPPQVERAYQTQFRRDFSAFLRSRYQELSVGGGMVLSFLGRNEKHTGHGDLNFLYGLLAKALNSMVSEGMVSEERINSFNLPVYGPSMAEVRSIIDSEGSFDVEESLVFESSWDPLDDDDLTSSDAQNAKNVADFVRATKEPLIARQFGGDILDELFSRFEDNLSRYLLLEEKANLTDLVIILKKKRA